MPLTPTPRAAIYGFGEFSILMMDDDRPVRVNVAEDLLTDMEMPHSVDEGVLFERLERHRARLQEIASVKYDGGDHGSDRDMYVVRISTKDWAG